MIQVQNANMYIYIAIYLATYLQYYLEAGMYNIRI